MLKDTLRLYIIFVIIGLVVLAIKILEIDIPLCYFNRHFGVYCPGCGLSSSYMALLKGNISMAFKYHPLFWSIPIIPVLYNLKNKYYFYGLMILFIIVWICRLHYGLYIK